MVFVWEGIYKEAEDGFSGSYDPALFSNFATPLQIINIV
jgi:hypothetical protein